jgi:hypothetical protein
VFVQTAIKGIGGIDRSDAQQILRSSGLQCNWWRRVHRIAPDEIDERLSSSNLDLHVNSYGEPHPTYRGRVCEETPFISLATGAVERSAFYKTNFVQPAHRTALLFATDFGRRRGDCFLFYCWVVVGLQPAVEVMSLSEEVRELNTYRRYSAFQLEGEVTAKVWIPTRQIHRFERYRLVDSSDGIRLSFVDNEVNPQFVDPQTVLNIRQAF